MKKTRKTRSKNKGLNEFLKAGNHVGIFFAIWFIICFVWFYINPVELELHQELLGLGILFFTGMNLFSFIIGAVQSYIWGYIAVATWMLASKISGWCR